MRTPTAQPMTSSTRPVRPAKPLRDVAASPGTRSVELPRSYPPYLLLGFVIAEFACQLALLSPVVAKARVVVRVAAFVGSLGLLFALRRPVQSHPSGRTASLGIVIVGLSTFHPLTVSAWAALATLLLYLSIVGPIFWVPRIRVDLLTLRRLILLFWAFHTVSALLGALQVYFPGQFQPALSSVFDDEAYLDALKIDLVDGSRVFRPMGLTDTPGGAAVSAAYSVMFGIGLLLQKPRPWLRITILVTMAFGLFSLYVSQVRSVLVMLGVSVLSLGLPFALQRQMRRFASIVAAVAGVAAIGFFLAVSVAGKTVTDRLSSLTESDPGTVYYAHRGLFLEDTLLNLVPSYPLGAGLGRWGMIDRYFGDRISSSPPLWAEICWTGWLYDGGVPLMIAYAGAIFIALRTSLRVARGFGEAHQTELQIWATVLFGYGVGALASTFNGQTFAGTGGVDFWVLNAALFAAYAQSSTGHS
jgi:hypothetical protein